MLQVINTLVPVFVIIAVGFLLCRKGTLSRTFMSELNWLIFWVSLPALIVHSLVTATELPKSILPVVGLFFTSTLLTILVSFLTVKILGLSRERIGTFVQAAFRGNLAYTGLPVVIFALHGRPPEVVSSAVALVMFVLAPSMLLYNGIAVFLLAGSQSGFSRKKLLGIFRKVALNPLILASVLGVVLFFLPLPIPAFFLNTFELTGQMAAPAALLCVGGAMAFVSMQGRYRSASVATGLKVIVLPSITALLLLFVELDSLEKLVLLVLSSCPTAVASYVMAKELGGDEALAAGSIIFSTIACIPILSLIIAFA